MGNNKVYQGINDLKTWCEQNGHMELLLEWHPIKNGNLNPACVAKSSAKKVWWHGKCGHDWQAQVSGRTSKGYGCAICSGKQVLAGFNDLQTKYPEIAEEWHPTKNNGLLPTDVTKNSNKKVWWLGKCGHEWSVSINSRTGKGHGCPYCTGQQVLTGFNDLQTKYPEIAAEWHPTKNGNLRPTDFTKGTHKTIWWLGKCGHEWPAPINRRVSQGSHCPICTGKQVLIGFNDLQTKYPEIAAEWHPTKNGLLTPKDVTAGSVNVDMNGLFQLTVELIEKAGVLIAIKLLVYLFNV